MSPYERHWTEQRWAALGSRFIINAEAWARLGKEALRAGLVAQIPNRVEPAESLEEQHG